MNFDFCGTSRRNPLLSLPVKTQIISTFRSPLRELFQGYSALWHYLQPQTELVLKMLPVWAAKRLKPATKFSQEGFVLGFSLSPHFWYIFLLFNHKISKIYEFSRLIFSVFPKSNLFLKLFCFNNYLSFFLSSFNIKLMKSFHKYFIIFMVRK